MEGYMERLANELTGLAHVDVSYRDRLSYLESGGLENNVSANNSMMLKNLSNLKVKVNARSPFDRRFTTWVGGSILSSLSSFDPMWVSSEEWKEHGEQILHKKLVL